MPLELNISDLASINNERDLANTSVEVVNTNGQNFKAGVPLLIQTVANNLPGANSLKSLVKSVKCYDTTDPQYVAGDSTLVGLAPDTLCVGAIAWVQHPAPARWYRLVLDPSGNVGPVSNDGAFTSTKTLAKWVEVDSTADRASGTADYSPFASHYALDEQVKYTLDGYLRLFVAKQALVPVNGLIPAPTGLSTDANWQEISATETSEAGRLLITAPDAQAQRRLLSNPNIAPNQYGSHPGFSTEDGPDGSWAWVIKTVLAAANAQVVKASAAPTLGQVDDTADTFSFLPNPDYPSFAQYKAVGIPGTSGAVVLDAGNSYTQGGRVYVKVVGAVAKGGLAVYVAGSGIVPDGAVLTNDAPFTGAPVVVTPPPTAALTAALAISVASIVAGNALTFTVTAAGGTTPYSYAVTATNNATGAVTVLGSSASGSFTPQTGGVSYNLDATVTDAAGKVAQAVTRTVQVNAPQAVNQLPVANAGDDLTITAPTSSAALMGTASDPDQGDTLTYLWRQITGPNSATGLPATSLNVVVSNLVPGTYQFGFQATDQKGGKSQEDFVVITVNTAPVPVGTRYTLGVAGDSLMTRYALAGEKSSVELTDDALPDSRFFVINNQAVPGAQLPAISAQIDSLIASRPADFETWIVLAEGGINDADGGSVPASEIITRLRANVAKLFAAGCRRIIVSTLTGFTPNNYNSAQTAAVNSIRATVNFHILTQAFSWPGVVAVVNPGQDVYLGADNISSNGYFVPDGVHYSLTGRSRMATIFYVPAFTRIANGEAGFIVNGTLINAPATPTAGVVNDGANTWGWTNAAGFLEVASYEYSTNYGDTFANVTAFPQPVGDFDFQEGRVGVRVKATANNPASGILFNTQPFKSSGVQQPVFINHDDPRLIYESSDRINAGYFSGTQGNVLCRETMQYDTLKVEFLRDGEAADVEVWVGVDASTEFKVGTYQSAITGGPADGVVIYTVPFNTYSHIRLVMVGVPPNGYRHYPKGITTYKA